MHINTHLRTHISASTAGSRVACQLASPRTPRVFLKHDPASVSDNFKYNNEKDRDKAVALLAGPPTSEFGNNKQSMCERKKSRNPEEEEEVLEEEVVVAAQQSVAGGGQEEEEEGDIPMALSAGRINSWS